MDLRNHVTCVVIKKLAVLREHGGNTRELRIVDWNGFGPKLDLHEWKADGKCGKGITLTYEEGKLLRDALVRHYELQEMETEERLVVDDRTICAGKAGETIECFRKGGGGIT